MHTRSLRIRWKRRKPEALTRNLDDNGRIVIVGELSLSAAGNQVLRRTIEAYLAIGCEVVYVTSAPIHSLAIEHPKLRVVSVDRIYRRLPNRLFSRRRVRSEPAQALPLASSSIQPMTSVIRQLVKLAWFVAVTTIPAYRETRRRNTRLVYGYEVFGGPVARLVAGLARTPAVGRFQGTPLHWSRKWAPLYSLGIRLGPRKVVMSNDGTYGDLVLARSNRGHESCLFLPDGVDETPDDSPQAALPHGFREKTDVAWASRQVDWKRPDIAVKAWANYIHDHREAWVDAGAPRLWMFGGGPLTDEVRRYASALGISDQIEIVGSAEYQVVQRSILASRCLLSTNDFSNLTNSVLAAMYHRVPVVARDWGQLASLAPDVVWTVTSHDCADSSVADMLEQCLASPNTCAPPFTAGLSWPQRMARELAFTLGTQVIGSLPTTLRGSAEDSHP